MKRGEEQRNDAVSGSKIDDFLPWFDLDEVGQQQSIERKTVARATLAERELAVKQRVKGFAGAVHKIGLFGWLSGFDLRRTLLFRAGSLRDISAGLLWTIASLPDS